MIDRAPVADQHPMVTAALAYQEAHGWSCVLLHGLRADGTACTCSKGAACTSAGKHPVSWEPLTKAMLTAAKHPWSSWRQEHNLGVLTGKASGIWCLDVDKGSGGFETLAKLEAKHGPLRASMVAATGGGGKHYIFSLPADWTPTNSTGRLPSYGAGLDVRGEGGLIVVAPSRSAKGPYSWIKQ